MMNKLIVGLVVILILALVYSFKEQRQRENFVRINNYNKVDGLALTLYVHQMKGWVDMGQFYVPRDSSKKFMIGTDHYYNYGYLGDHGRVVVFPSKTVNFY